MTPSSTYLLDTNVLLHLLRGRKQGQLIDGQYQLRSNLHHCLISIVTAGELYTMAARRNWGTQRLSALDSLLKHVVIVDISHPDITKAYAEIGAASKGKAIQHNDMWIAATCKVANAVLLTADTDFDHLNGTQINREFVETLNQAKTSNHTTLEP